MLIGDVLAVVAGVFGISFSVWAMLLASALTFEKVAHRSKAALETRPIQTFLTGVVVALTAGLFAIALLNQPNGLLKLIGWVSLLGLLALGGLGSGGLVLSMSERLKRLDDSLSPFATYARGAGVLVVSGLVPVLGWFVIVPLSVILSFGMGLRSLRPTRPAATEPILAPASEMESIS